MDDSLAEFAINKERAARLKDKKWLSQQFAEGVTGQEILGYSQELMGRLYRAASRLLDRKQYDSAADAFLFLATLNPYVPAYWTGLGMTLQLKGEYESALDAYEIAALYSLENPIPYFYLAKCLFALHERKSALEALDLAIAYSSDNIEYLDLRQQAEEARKLLLGDSKDGDS